MLKLPSMYMSQQRIEIYSNIVLGAAYVSYFGVLAFIYLCRFISFDLPLFTALALMWWGAVFWGCLSIAALAVKSFLLLKYRTIGWKQITLLLLCLPALLIWFIDEFTNF